MLQETENHTDYRGNKHLPVPHIVVRGMGSTKGGTLMTIPVLTEQQLSSARSAATEARRRRADFKNQVKSGELSFATALDIAESDDVLAHIRVVDLLKSMRGIGDKRALEVMQRMEIAQNRRIRGLGCHQVSGLKAEFN